MRGAPVTKPITVQSSLWVVPLRNDNLRYADGASWSQAIIRVLETAPKDRPLEIRSDSKYSINCGCHTTPCQRPDCLTSSAQPSQL